MRNSVRAAAWTLCLVVAFGTGSCKHHPFSDVEEAAAGQVIDMCKAKDEHAKFVGMLFSTYLMGVAAMFPMTGVGGMIKGGVNGASTASKSMLPSLIGTCNVTDVTLQQLKRDIDLRLGDILDDLNALDQKVIKNSLVFYNSNFSEAVANLEIYRSQILANGSGLDSYTTNLAASYAKMAISLSSITESVKSESSVVFMAAAYDLANAHAYFGLLEHEKLLDKVLAAPINPSTKGQFIHNFDLMAERYINFLTVLAERKKTADLPYLTITNLGGRNISKGARRKGRWITKNTYKDYDCPYTDRYAQQTPVPMAITFRDDHVTSFRYEYTSFGGKSGSGQILPEKLEGFEVALMTRPADKKSRHGYAAVVLDFCDAAPYRDNNDKAAAAVAAAIEEDPAAAKNEALARLNKAVNVARDMYEAIDAKGLEDLAARVKAGLNIEPRWQYKFVEATGTGVPDVVAATPPAAGAAQPAAPASDQSPAPAAAAPAAAAQPGTPNPAAD